MGPKLEQDVGKSGGAGAQGAAKGAAKGAGKAAGGKRKGGKGAVAKGVDSKGKEKDKEAPVDTSAAALTSVRFEAAETKDAGAVKRQYGRLGTAVSKATPEIQQ